MNISSVPGFGDSTKQFKSFSWSTWGNRNVKYLGEILNRELNLTDAICANSTDMYIGGMGLSTEYNYIKITLSRWSGKSTCKSSTEIDTALSGLSLRLGMTDYYFDSEDYSNPVKIFVNADLSYYTLKGMTKSIDVRIRKNEVTDQKSPYYFTPSESYSFFSIGETFVDTSALFYEPNTVLKINIALDSKYNVINRSVYSLGDMFGQIGGMDSIMVSIGSIFVGVFSAKIFMESLLSTFYYVTSDRKETKIIPLKIIEEETKDLQVKGIYFKVRIA